MTRIRSVVRWATLRILSIMNVLRCRIRLVAISLAISYSFPESYYKYSVPAPVRALLQTSEKVMEESVV